MSAKRPSTRRLPARPSLEKLKKHAKALLGAVRADDADALGMVQTFHPRPAEFSGLRDAQLTLARLYGCADWQALTEAVELRQLRSRSVTEQAALFVDHACLRYNGDDRSYRYRLAVELLAGEPRIARVDLYAALVAGDVDAVRAALAADASGINLAGGPRGWPPLLYLTYSRVPAPVGAVREILGLLLGHGADPNSQVMLDGTYRFSALAGAMGEGERGPVDCPPHPEAGALVRMLLEAGADPNESQGLYNTMFTDSIDQWLPILIEHGLNSTHRAWAADNPRTTFDFFLALAATEGRFERVRLLVEHGADPNAVNDYNGRSCHTNALIRGHEELAAWLVAHGARVEPLNAADQFRLALRRDDDAELARLLAAHPALKAEPALLREAMHYGPERARWMLAQGFDINGQTPDGRTLLMDHAQRSQVSVVRALVEHGADPDIVENSYGATALGFALHNRNWPVVEYLVGRSNSLLDVSSVPDVERARVLLERNPALVTSRTKRGNTPLHLVSQAREQDLDPDASAALIDLLLAHGADIEARNDEGLTPLAWFRQRGIDEIVELLAARGARREPGD